VLAVLARTRATGASAADFTNSGEYDRPERMLYLMKDGLYEWMPYHAPTRISHDCSHDFGAKELEK
jgi:hypothetical protein